jgi:Na+-translocating ferredoxin:NAD+ oxidoreductase RnfG subunit
MKLRNLSHFATALVIVLGLAYLPTQAQVMGFYHTQKNIQTDEVLPQTSNETANIEEGIDFTEWDKDLEKSIRKAERKCKGKNCNFKPRQALESSFDF